MFKSQIPVQVRIFLLRPGYVNSTTNYVLGNFFGLNKAFVQILLEATILLIERIKLQNNFLGKFVFIKTGMLFSFFFFYGNATFRLLSHDLLAE